MKESAVSEKKAGSVSAQRAKEAASLTRDGLKAVDQPLMSIVQRAGCRDCGPSVQSLAGGMMQTPVAQRQAAAMSLQMSRGNRFVQGMAVQAKPAAVGAMTAKSASPVVQRYVKVGLYEGSFGMDHIGVGVNSEKTKGFSPKPGLGREAERGAWVEGEVKEDHDQIDSLTIRTSSSQEARLQAALNRSESSSQKFNLYQHNCAQHGAEILKSAGLSVKNSPLPRAFFDELKRQYAPGPGEAAADGVPVQGKFESGLPAAEPAKAAPGPNRTGMPDRLKAGIESLSDIDMSDVRVHANSELPAKLDALACTQGSQIYLGPGQERHLPHEAWHAVQQKQGRVRTTTQMKGQVVNDDTRLETEADRMGGMALHGRVISALSARGDNELALGTTPYFGTPISGNWRIRRIGIGNTLQFVKRKYPWKNEKKRYQEGKPSKKRVEGDAEWLAIRRFSIGVTKSFRDTHSVEEVLEEAAKQKGLKYDDWKGTGKEGTLQEAQHLVPASIAMKPFKWPNKRINSPRNAKMLLAGRKGKGVKLSAEYIRAKRERNPFFRGVQKSIVHRTLRWPSHWQFPARGVRHITTGVAHAKYNESVKGFMEKYYKKHGLNEGDTIPKKHFIWITSYLRKLHKNLDRTTQPDKGVDDLMIV